MINRLLELCLPLLISHQEYIDRLDSIPSSSSDIQTLQEAKDYWVKHFNTGVFHRIECKYGKKKYVFQVKFVRNHAYTENTTGSSRDEDRLLDLVRARHMDEIWQVLRYPDGIIESKSGRGYRQFDKKITIENTLYGRVVLDPKPTPEDTKDNKVTHFEFVSWHMPETKQHEEAKRLAAVTHVSPIKKAPPKW